MNDDMWHGFLLILFFLLVCLQPFVFDPNEKNKHKFMVQSLVAPDGEINAEQLVSLIDEFKRSIETDILYCFSGKT